MTEKKFLPSSWEIIVHMITINHNQLHN